VATNRDPYAEEQAGLLASRREPAASPASPLGEDDDRPLLTPAQLARQRRRQKEDATAARLEPKWREHRRIVLRDANALARLLDRYNEMLGRWAKDRQQAGDNLLFREFKFIFEPAPETLSALPKPERPPVRPPQPLELRAALSLAVAWIHEPDTQVPAALDWAHYYRSRMLALYRAVTDEPRPTWERITRIARGAPPVNLADPISLAQLPKLREQWARIQQGTSEILEACRTIARDREVALDGDLQPFERKAEAYPSDYERWSDALDDAENRAERLAERECEELLAAGKPLLLPDGKPAANRGEWFHDRVEEVFRRICRQRGVDPDARRVVRDPETPAGVISDTDAPWTFAARTSNLAQERLAIIDWFLGDTQPMMMIGRGPQALRPLGDVAYRLYEAFGGRSARRRGNVLRALSRTKSVISAIWCVEFTLPQLRNRIAKRHSGPKSTKSKA
jgi:hypothetical protein